MAQKIATGTLGGIGEAIGFVITGLMAVWIRLARVWEKCWPPRD